MQPLVGNVLDQIIVGQLVVGNERREEEHMLKKMRIVVDAKRKRQTQNASNVADAYESILD